MAVRRELRRTGIGREILRALVKLAIQRGYDQLVLETTADWVDAIAFYQSQGFVFEGVSESEYDVNFRLSLPA